MKLFLLGAPCAGKTMLMLPLRATLTYPVLDMDEEILRLNGGRWPPIEAKQGLPEKSSMRRPATMMWCSPAASLATNNWAC